MTTNAFRHRPPEQCTLSKEDQQHILRISNNDQELLDELMAILRQLRPLPPRGASVRHTSRCDRRAQQESGQETSEAAPPTNLRLCQQPLENGSGVSKQGIDPVHEIAKRLVILSDPTPGASHELTGALLPMSSPPT